MPKCPRVVKCMPKLCLKMGPSDALKGIPENAKSKPKEKKKIPKLTKYKN